MSAAAPPVVLVVAWIALLASVAWRWRPAPVLRNRLSALPAPWSGAPLHERSTTGPRRGHVNLRHWLDHLAEAVGSRLRRLAQRPSDPRTDRRLGAAVAVAVAAAVVAGPLGVAAGVVTWWWPAAAARRQQHRAEASIVSELPDTVDLFALAVGAGLNVSLAVNAVAPRAPPVTAAALGPVVAEVAAGARVAEALEAALLPLGEPVRPLVGALVSADRYGTPLGPALDRVAADGRLARRRRAEESARRVPVKLLFPLVFCALPAFVLLTVVPLLAGTVRLLDI